MQELLDAGVHFGHQTRRWNPKMRQYIFGRRNGIYIIDLQRTMELFDEAAEYVSQLARQNRRILFVGTKRQAQLVIAEEARRCGQYFVSHRWLGGMLTNFVTIRASVERMKEIEKLLTDESNPLIKKERLRLERDLATMTRNLDGIRDMDRLPDALFVVDPKREHIAISEAAKLGIPVIGLVDTNCDPQLIDYVIPGNDDAIRTIRLFCSRIADAYQDGAGVLNKVEPLATPEKPAAEAKAATAAPAAKAAAEVAAEEVATEEVAAEENTDDTDSNDTESEENADS